MAESTAGLRCRPGDIAVVFNPRFRNFGKFVAVLERDTEVERIYGRPAWSVESLGLPLFQVWLDNGETAPSAMRTNFYDRDLFPLRDQGGDDESLRWTARPTSRLEPSQREILDNFAMLSDEDQQILRARLRERARRQA